jgi:hypothetical protein
MLCSYPCYGGLVVWSSQLAEDGADATKGDEIVCATFMVSGAKRFSVRECGRLVGYNLVDNKGLCGDLNFDIRRTFSRCKMATGMVGS